MLYKALDNKEVEYLGNNISDPRIIKPSVIDEILLTDRVNRVKNEPMFEHIANIDSAIFMASVEYFSKIKAKWLNVPLTTLMISSPGEVYAGQNLDYTTDTLPVEIPDWFGTGKRIFLSESSQFYLELSLLIKGMDSVFSIYNSFRKEMSDATHLSEFQHIEFEGKVDSEENIRILTGLYKHIFESLVRNNSDDLLFFLSPEQLGQKIELTEKGPIRIDFIDALRMLYEATGEDIYKDFTLKHFGTWEEVKLTELLGANVIVEKFPMLQIPFYHAVAEEEVAGVPVAKNADFILNGYRETIGAGERVKNKAALLEKARLFNLPEEDYMPYLQSRDFSDYEVTSGFGLGYQRLVQWIINQPYIYESTIFPRTNLIPNP